MNDGSDDDDEIESTVWRLAHFEELSEFEAIVNDGTNAKCCKDTNGEELNDS